HTDCRFSFTSHLPPYTYTLSLHDALPIFVRCTSPPSCCCRTGGRRIALRAIRCSSITATSRATWRATAGATSRPTPARRRRSARSEEHTSELQSRSDLVCRLLLEKKKKHT